MIKFSSRCARRSAGAVGECEAILFCSAQMGVHWHGRKWLLCSRCVRCGDAHLVDMTERWQYCSSRSSSQMIHPHLESLIVSLSCCAMLHYSSIRYALSAQFQWRFTAMVPFAIGATETSLETVSNHFTQTRHQRPYIPSDLFLRPSEI